MQISFNSGKLDTCTDITCVTVFLAAFAANSGSATKTLPSRGQYRHAAAQGNGVIEPAALVDRAILMNFDFFIKNHINCRPTSLSQTEGC